MATVPGSPFLNPLFTVIEFAAGTAMGPALRPVIQDLANFAWSEHSVRTLDPHDLATFVARQIPTTMNTVEWAANWGLDSDRFKDLVELFRAYPDLETLLRLWRRNPDNQPHIPGALNRHGFSDDWTARVLTLVDERLAPAQIALAIVRSIIADPGLMPVQLDTSGGVVPAYTQSSIDPLTEALDSGIDKERLRVMVGEIGLPMSNQQAASALFRGLIRQGDYYRAILEGDTRPEWADAILEQARQIPTAHDFVEGRLRAWIDDKHMYDGTAKHGMSTTDTDLLFKITGRPISFRQVFIGERRGGTYGEGNAGIDPAFLKSLQESNIRPEWYQLAWAQRHSLPSAFVIRRLATDGDITPAQTTELLMWLGWPEWLVTAVVTSWTGGTTGADAALVKSARTSAITEVKNAYLVNQADATQARGWLEAVGVTSQTVDALLPIWDVMKQVPQRGLTAAQIKKAFRDLPAKYPLTWATAELLALGYTTEDAAAILEL